MVQAIVFGVQLGGAPRRQTPLRPNKSRTLPRWLAHGSRFSCCLLVQPTVISNHVHGRHRPFCQFSAMMCTADTEVPEQPPILSAEPELTESKTRPQTLWSLLIRPPNRATEDGVRPHPLTSLQQHLLNAALAPSAQWASLPYHVWQVDRSRHWRWGSSDGRVRGV